MAKHQLSGKLAVILHADVADSTLLVQRDEQLAHARIQDAFRRFADTITQYHGRVQELRGDALLAEFERASDAVTAALAFQSNHQVHLAKMQDPIQPKLRVGIALGEVVIANKTVTGAGVVLAQRVEQLAESGGLCITSAIHEALPNRMPFVFESLGEQQLKGFEEPVRAYRITLNPGETIPAPQAGSRRQASAKTKKLILAIALGTLLTAAGTLYWFTTQLPRQEPASVARMAFTLPDKPSLVVLPFDNISDDKQQEYFADGITDDLLTGLSKLPELFLISRNTSFTYKGQAVKIRQVAEELGVRYVMEGSVRRAGDTVRINVQLIDALTGGHVWAEKYDGDIGDIFKLQDEVVAKIVYSLDQNIIPQKTTAETDVPEAYDRLLQGLKHSYFIEPDSLVTAIAYFKQAIELDPGYYRAHAHLADTYSWIVESEWQSELNMTRAQVNGLIRQHLNIALEKPTATAYRVSAWLAIRARNYEVALENAEKAIALDPNDPFNFNMKAHILSRTGFAKQAEQNALRAIRLNPKSAGTHYRQLGQALFHQDRFEEAVDAYLRSISLDPDYKWHYLSLAAVYGQLGELQKARTALAKFEESGTQWAPDGLTVRILSGWREYTDLSYRDRYLQGLRQAGMPES